jgi:hypothetical protein
MEPAVCPTVSLSSARKASEIMAGVMSNKTAPEFESPDDRLEQTPDHGAIMNENRARQAVGLEVSGHTGGKHRLIDYRPARLRSSPRELCDELRRGA